jgi:hypothetical protein
MINRTLVKAKTKIKPRRIHTSPETLPPPSTSGVLVGEDGERGESVLLGIGLLSTSEMGDGVLEGSSVGLTVSDTTAVSVFVAVCVAVLLGDGSNGVSLAWGGFEGCVVGWLCPCVAVLVGVALTS